MRSGPGSLSTRSCGSRRRRAWCWAASVSTVGPPGCLGPQPLGVAGEALVEPDVAPAPDAHAVAEPLVGELVRDEPLGVGVEVIGAEDREPLRLERDLERIRRHDDRAVVLRVGPEGVLEDVDHARHIAEGVGHAELGAPAGERDARGRAASRRSDRCARRQGRSRRAGRSRTPTWCGRACARGGAPTPVAATRSPRRSSRRCGSGRGRRAGRCTGTRSAPRSAEPRRATPSSSSSHPIAPHRDRRGAGAPAYCTSIENGLPRLERRGGMTRSFRGLCCIERARVAVDAHAARAQPHEVERHRARVDRRDSIDDGPPLEAVRAHAVLDVEVVRLDVERQVAALRRVVVLFSHDVDW